MLMFLFHTFCGHIKFACEVSFNSGEEFFFFFLQVRRNDHACRLSDSLYVVLKARCGGVEIEVN